MKPSTALAQPPATTDTRPPPAREPSGLIGVVRRSPLVAFLILSCVLSWAPALLYLANLSPAPVAGFGPFLAALVVLGMTQGRDGVRALLRSMVAWRAPARAYALALGLPLLITGAAVLTNLALGAARPAAADVALLAELPITFLLLLLVPGVGGSWEEPGFRGFALPRFEKRFGMTAGPLLLGLFWVFWHLPLFLAGDIRWTDVLVIVAASVVIAAVFHTGRERVLIAMLIHAMNNTIGGAFASQLFSDADDARLGLLTAGAWWLAAAAVLLKRRRATAR
jgi:membrane protease YdiL (CAAX protease family)